MIPGFVVVGTHRRGEHEEHSQTWVPQPHTRVRSWFALEHVPLRLTMTEEIQSPSIFYTTSKTMAKKVGWGRGLLRHP